MELLLVLLLEMWEMVLLLFEVDNGVVVLRCIDLVV